MSSLEELWRYKPQELSDEEWQEILEELNERKSDNDEHRTVQVKLKPLIKVVALVIIIPLIVAGFFLAWQYQGFLYTGASILVIIALIYLYAVEQTAGE